MITSVDGKGVCIGFCLVFNNEPDTLLVDVDEGALVGLGFVSAGWDVNQEENHDDEDDFEDEDDGETVGDGVTDGDGTGEGADLGDDA